MASSIGQIATPGVIAKAMGLSVAEYYRSNGTVVENTIMYGDFKFPYNPETSSMTCDRKYIEHKYINVYGSELEDFGPNAIVITGDGEFVGFGAYVKWDKLYTEFRKNGVTNVFHPIFTNVTRGLMTKLKATVEPRSNYVKYSFEIVADEDQSPPYEEWTTNGAEVVEVTNGGDESTTTQGTRLDVYEGDIVYFTGNTHYTSSYPDSAKYSTQPCKANITQINWDNIDDPEYHPYHLVHCSGENSTLWGWVNASDIQPISNDAQTIVSDDIRNGGAIVHTVVDGESLSQICYRYATQYNTEVDWYIIAQRNNIVNPDVISPGDKINITSTGVSW